ncbi:tripartite tricarboxylate transporter substrate binding protein [Chelativorans sp.]|uniref:Bug family tripartite tricarboxylate transporter substrate binding protein n=1 Tax=Chelativorans sp. TaxID=2203393 RepID=UPI00281218D8|nr:tripartite tricarboxylate transporter substrate binding protein [Chelativorans sp.]
MTAVAALLIGGPALAQDYPSRDIQGTIMWGAGGATDNLARVMSPAAEEILGAKIVLVNRPGGVGAIAMQYVHSRPSDGYNILFGAENPQLHKVLGLSNLDYNEFYPVIIVGRNIQVFVVNPDAKWKTLTELVNDIKANPGQIRMGATGPGGSPAVSMGMLNSVVEGEVTQVPFDGEGPGLTALQGGHVDFMPVSLPAAAELLRAGRVRGLVVLDKESLAQFPDIPPITNEYPELGQYLPWGSFQGVFVKRDAPDEVKKTLTEAFAKAVEVERVDDFIQKSGMVKMGISGAEADEFMKRWQSVTSWILQDTGDAKVSPEEVGIPRP